MVRSVACPLPPLTRFPGVTAILPQGRAALTSASASYQAGRGTFLSVLNGQATLFAYETEYYRDLTDFAKTLAELESVIGAEVLP